MAVLSRAESFFPHSVGDLPMFTHAGTFFPDAFYTCMGQAEAAEAAHWPPFLKVAVDYWNEKYNTSKQEVAMASGGLWDGIRRRVFGSDAHDLAGAGLRAFIYGMMVHQVADVSWHSLGVREGLLRAMAERDFDGDTSKAHQVLDIGGDILLLYRLLSSDTEMSWLDFSWDYPRADILNIFERAGYTISPGQLEYCMRRGQAGLKAERSIVRALHSSYARLSPMLFNNLESYYLGGLSEMVMSARHCSKNLDIWFEEGTSDDPWSICAVFEGMRYRNLHNSSVCTSVFDDQGKLTKNITGIEESGAESAAWLRSSPDRDRGTTLDYIFTTGEQQSQFGSSLAVGKFWNGDMCLAVGAPFDGRLTDGSNPPGSAYVIPLDDIVHTSIPQLTGFHPGPVVLHDPAIQRRHMRISRELRQIPLILSSEFAVDTVEGYTYNYRFGASAIGFIVLGRDILCISRPGVSELELYDDGAPVLRISIDSTSKRYGSGGRKLVGEYLASGDINGDGTTDLIIGAPYADSNGKPHQGEVCIVAGKYITRVLENNHDGTLLVSPTREPVETISCPKKRAAYSMFGSRVTIARATTGKRYIVVGAEGLNTVYGFDGETLSLVFSLEPDAHGSFGGDILLGGDDGLLIVGSSQEDEGSCTQCGFVYIYDIGDPLKQKPELVSKVSSPDRVSWTKFGFQGTRHNNMVYISSPYAQDFKGSIWELDLHGPMNVRTIVSSGPPPYYNGFGSSIAVSETKGKRRLYIGMPYYGRSLKNDLQGGVAVYSLE